MDDRSQPAWQSQDQGQHPSRDWQPEHTGEQPRPDRQPEQAGDDSRADWEPEHAEYADGNAQQDWQPEHAGHSDGQQDWEPEQTGHSDGQQDWEPEHAGHAEGLADWPGEQSIGGAQPMWPDEQPDGKSLQVWPADQPVGEPVGGYRVQEDLAAQSAGAYQAQPSEDQYGQSPIFEEMASAWFRDNWAVAPAADEDRLVPAPEVPAPPLPDEPADGWGSGDGWDSGEPLLQPFTEVAASEYTPVGLPKRQRGAHLIPGGAATSASNPEPAVPVPSRSADQVRSRLGSYQQGVRAGRRHRLEDRISEDAAGESLNEEMG
jgi:hypothetical protein